MYLANDKDEFAVPVEEEDDDDDGKDEEEARDNDTLEKILIITNIF